MIPNLTDQQKKVWEYRKSLGLSDDAIVGEALDRLYEYFQFEIEGNEADLVCLAKWVKAPKTWNKETDDTRS